MSKFSGLSLGINRAIRVPLRNPLTNQPILEAGTNEPAWIEVLPQAGQVGLAHDRENLDKQIARNGQRMTAKEVDDQYSEKLAALTTGWNLIDGNGAKIDLPCNRQNALELYSDPECFWIRNLVSEFSGTLGNWRPAPSAV